MATCKNCISEKVCRYNDGVNLYCKEDYECPHFKNKADFVEVKHGEWIEDAYYDNPCVCSYCGVEAPYFNKFEETFDYDWEENLISTGHKTIKEYIRTQYCHRCGAKMDGGKEE